MWPVPVLYQQYNSCICIEPQVSCLGFYLNYTSNWMSIFKTLFTQKTDYWEETSTGQKSQQLCWFGA